MNTNDELLDDRMENNPYSNTVAHRRYAGFWIRVGAALIDVLVLLPIIAINIYNSFVLKSLVLAILMLLITTVYKPAMEYLYGATVGKMAMKIRVVGTDYESISLSSAVLRYSPWLLSNILTLFTTIMMFTHEEFYDVTGLMELGVIQSELGFSSISTILGLLVFVCALAIVFNDKKQGLHDMIAGTYCIEK